MDSGSFFPRNVQAAQSRQLIHLGRLRRANESALAQISCAREEERVRDGGGWVDSDASSAGVTGGRAVCVCVCVNAW